MRRGEDPRESKGWGAADRQPWTRGRQTPPGNLESVPATAHRLQAKEEAAAVRDSHRAGATEVDAVSKVCSQDFPCSFRGLRAQGLSEGTYANSGKFSQKAVLVCVTCMAL